MKKIPYFSPLTRNFQAKAKRHDFYAILILDNLLGLTLEKSKNIDHDTQCNFIYDHSADNWSNGIWNNCRKRRGNRSNHFFHFNGYASGISAFKPKTKWKFRLLKYFEFEGRF